MQLAGLRELDFSALIYRLVDGKNALQVNLHASHQTQEVAFQQQQSMLCLVPLL
jgi:hypothetical protein